MKRHCFMSYEQICDRIEALQRDFTPKTNRELKKLLKRKQRLDKKAAKIFLM